MFDTSHKLVFIFLYIVKGKISQNESDHINDEVWIYLCDFDRVNLVKIEVSILTLILIYWYKSFFVYFKS